MGIYLLLLGVLLLIVLIFGGHNKCSCGSTKLSFVRKKDGISTYKCWECKKETNFKE